MKIFLATGMVIEVVRALEALRYPYRLCSYYYLRQDKDLLARILEQQDEAEWIMDSGLFSLMFGSEKGTLTTYDQFRRYAETYLEDVDKWGWKGAIVECDAQKLIGTELTERLRDDVFRQSGREVIYVWHLPDGNAGLDRIAKRHERIALSVPEFRAAKIHGVSTRQLCLAGIVRAKSVSPDVRIHLLGNTDPANKLTNFPVESGDSSSWASPARWGVGGVYNPTTRFATTISCYSPKWRAWMKWCTEHYQEAFASAEAIGVKEPNLIASAISYLVMSNGTTTL